MADNTDTEETGMDSGYLNSEFKDEAPTKNEMDMTFGEKLVGLTFNPSNSDRVFQVKSLCADLADILWEHVSDKTSQGGLTTMDDLLFTTAINNILSAQMHAVKFLTNKY